jgi:hypothetical protein
MASEVLRSLLGRPIRCWTLSERRRAGRRSCGTGARAGPIVREAIGPIVESAAYARRVLLAASATYLKSAQRRHPAIGLLWRELREVPTREVIRALLEEVIRTVETAAAALLNRVRDSDDFRVLVGTTKPGRHISSRHVGPIPEPEPVSDAIGLHAVGGPVCDAISKACAASQSSVGGGMGHRNGLLQAEFSMPGDPDYADDPTGMERSKIASPIGPSAVGAPPTRSAHTTAARRAPMRVTLDEYSLSHPDRPWAIARRTKPIP